MEQTEHNQNQQKRQIFTHKKLPLAVYLEIAAHLRQVWGVTTGLLPQQAEIFDYDDSQVGGIWIEYSQEVNQEIQEQVKQILNYYQLIDN
ncbi:MAG TPA: hypothetical protein V6C58_25690 [Allocoleopsis sp.]